MDLNNDSFIDMFRSIAGRVMPLFGAVLIAISLWQIVKALWRKESPRNWFTVIGILIEGAVFIIVGIRLL